MFSLLNLQQSNGIWLILLCMIMVELMILEFNNVCMVLFGNLFSRFRITLFSNDLLKKIPLFALGSICLSRYCVLMTRVSRYCLSREKMTCCVSFYIRHKDEAIYQHIIQTSKYSTCRLQVDQQHTTE